MKVVIALGMLALIATPVLAYDVGPDSATLGSSSEIENLVPVRPLTIIEQPSTRDAATDHERTIQPSAGSALSRDEVLAEAMWRTSKVAGTEGLPRTRVAELQEDSAQSYLIAGGTVLCVAGLVLFAVLRNRGRAPAAAQPTHGRIAVDTRSFVRAVAEPSMVRLDIQHASSDFPVMRDVGRSSFGRTSTTPTDWPSEPNERINYNLAEYRLYRLNVTGIVDTAESALFADDGAALAHARVFGNGQTVEVWQGSREVAVIPGRTAETSDMSADYRFHRLDATGSVSTMFRQRLQNDAEAMLHAITLSQGDNIDVWSPLRRLGTVRSGSTMAGA